jgi:hypothetical protein
MLLGSTRRSVRLRTRTHVSAFLCPSGFREGLWVRERSLAGVFGGEYGERMAVLSRWVGGASPEVLISSPLLLYVQ